MPSLFSLLLVFAGLMCARPVQAQEPTPALALPAPPAPALAPPVPPAPALAVTSPWRQHRPSRLHPMISVGIPIVLAGLALGVTGAALLVESQPPYCPDCGLGALGGALFVGIGGAPHVLIGSILIGVGAYRQTHGEWPR